MSKYPDKWDWSEDDRKMLRFFGSIAQSTNIIPFISNQEFLNRKLLKFCDLSSSFRTIKFNSINRTLTSESKKGDLIQDCNIYYANNEHTIKFVYLNQWVTNTDNVILMDYGLDIKWLFISNYINPEKWVNFNDDFLKLQLKDLYDKYHNLEE